jgi:murein DD-endopeptidase MepM/ murein hydrolase activator NlpD
MFDDPWLRANLSKPILPSDLSQPLLALPFEPNVQWNLVQGPHGAWQHVGALAAIDLAPSTDHGACDPTPTWVLAAAPGLVIRSGNGVVLVDMDGDGYEQTGWNLLYMHMATEDRVKMGTQLKANDRIGHASCEGGTSFGTHLHFARKYNGEWIFADGPISFVLSGWTVFGEPIPHDGFMSGSMLKGSMTVIADEVGQKQSNITREKSE